MAQTEVNKNYTHACEHQLVNINHNICSIAQIGYTAEEFKQILEFYVLNAPILKSDKTDVFGMKSLRDFGWKGSSDMNRLERELLKSSQIPNFCFIKSTSINKTLEQMLLSTQICSKHPRAVLKQDYSVTVLESGCVEVSNKETRMECLFRHIRNSIAHNHIYAFDNGNILLEDIDNQSKGITARILLPKTALLKWIGIVKKETDNKDIMIYDSQETTDVKSA